MKTNKSSIRRSSMFLYTNIEFMQLFGISKSTAFRWRTAQKIAHSKIEQKIFYRFTDIIKLLDNYYKPSKFE